MAWLVKWNTYRQPSCFFLKKFKDGFRLKRETVGFDANGEKEFSALKNKTVVVRDSLSENQVDEVDIATGNDPAVSGADFWVGDIRDDDVGLAACLEDGKHSINGMFVVGWEYHHMGELGLTKTSFEGTAHSKVNLVGERAKARVTGGNLCCDLRSSIGTAIVND